MKREKAGKKVRWKIIPSFRAGKRRKFEGCSRLPKVQPKIPILLPVIRAPAKKISEPNLRLTVHV